MALKNLVHNTFPSVAHCPGRYIPKNLNSLRLFESLGSAQEPKVSVPHDLSIVTWNDSPSPSGLELQCKRMNLDLVVLGRNSGSWRNGMKGPLLIEFAKRAKTEFIMAMDAFDVLIQGDVKPCVDEIRRVGCDILFGGECFSSHQSDDNITQFEADRYVAPWRYLNSGVMIARREFLINLPHVEWGGSDQMVWRDMHRSLWPRIRVDDRCRVFQNMNVVAGDTVGRCFSITFRAPRLRY